MGEGKLEEEDEEEEGKWEEEEERRRERNQSGLKAGMDARGKGRKLSGSCVCKVSSVCQLGHVC